MKKADCILFFGISIRKRKSDDACIYLCDGVVQSNMHYLIVNHLVKFAKELKLKIVTEGVERKEQYEMLIALGCDDI